MTPLLPLESRLRYFGVGRLRGALSSQGSLHARFQHFHTLDGLIELHVKGHIVRVQVVYLALQNFLQASDHEVQAALDFRPKRRGVLGGLELREAWGPRGELLPIGFFLEGETNEEFILLMIYMKCPNGKGNFSNIFMLQTPKLILIKPWDPPPL